jgi:uncharacterized protein (DUF2141 family)
VISRLAIFIISLALLAQTANANAAAGTITVTVTKLRNDLGRVTCRLFNADKGFPVEEADAIQVKAAPITKTESRISFAPIPAGVYAVACFHDENGNNKYDLGLFGIPLEGSVASNDAKGLFGPPSFNDAKFPFFSGLIELRLSMSY